MQLAISVRGTSAHAQPSANNWGCAVLGQKSAGKNPCIPIEKKVDDRRADFRAAKKDVAEKLGSKR